MSDVTIKLTLGNFSAEVTGPAEYADKKLDDLVERFFSGGRKLIGSELRPPEGAAEPTGKRISPAEFLKRFTANNQTDRALLLGYYLEHIESISSFTSSELATLSKEVKRPFGNVSDVISQLASRGLMMSAGDKEGKRSYSLTASGEEFVESVMQSK